MKEIKKEEIELLINKGVIHNTNKGFVNKNGCIVGFYKTTNKRYIEDKYSFDDCIYKRKLRFDFYLPDYNVCIEFQGLQHYIAVDYMGGDVDFQNRQIRDNIKKEYCKSNNIYLIEIPYNKIENINDILEKHLKKSSA